jgi:hypothetical protein
MMANLADTFVAMVDDSSCNMLVNHAAIVDGRHYARTLMLDDLFMFVDNVYSLRNFHEPLDSYQHRLLHCEVMGGSIMDSFHDSVGHLSCLSVLLYCTS